MKKDDLVKEIKEIIELVKICPQNLQEKCFEILLSHALSQRGVNRPPAILAEKELADKGMPTVAGKNISAEVQKRLKTFAGQHQLTEDEILKLFNLDDAGSVSVEATGLKSKKVAQQQRRLALLIGVKHQLAEGSFDVPKDELREACVTYGAYDAANFVQNLKNMKEIFAGFKPTVTNKLSPLGKKQAAELIKELVS